MFFFSEIYKQNNDSRKPLKSLIIENNLGRVSHVQAMDKAQVAALT